MRKPPKSRGATANPLGEFRKLHHQRDRRSAKNILVEAGGDCRAREACGEIDPIEPWGPREPFLGKGSLGGLRPCLLRRPFVGLPACPVLGSMNQGKLFPSQQTPSRLRVNRNVSDFRPCLRKPLNRNTCTQEIPVDPQADFWP